MRNTSKTIPELRFPEFDDEWEIKRVGECSIKVGSGSTPKGGEKVYKSEGIPFIRSQNIINNQLVMNDIVYISEDINNRMKGSIVKPSDILFNITGASIGRSCVVPKSFKIGNVNQHVCIIRLNDNYLSTFFQLFLSSDNGQKLVWQNQTGSGREGLNFQSIRGFKLFAPSLSEQRKIANFLSWLDVRIRKLTDKKTLLEQYKKGIMQKIFSQQLRFKDKNGNDFADWKEIRAKDIFKSYANKNHNGDLPILSASQELGMVYRDDNGIQIQSSESSVKSYKIVEKGDFVISLRSFQGGIEYSDIKGICSPAYTILKPKIEIDTHFFKYYFKKESFISRLSQTVVGIRDGKQISYGAFSGLKLVFPPIAEQGKIANFLSALDKKIDLVNQQIEENKRYKKGLLQQMFI